MATLEGELDGCQVRPASQEKTFQEALGQGKEEVQLRSEAVKFKRTMFLLNALPLLENNERLGLIELFGGS